MKITTLASGSSGNAYVISDGKAVLLLEAGLPVHRLCGLTDIAALDACCVTHEHMDHGRGAKDLAVRYGVPVIASPGTLSALQLSGNWLAEPINHGEEIRAKSLVIKAFDVPHDAAQPLGFLIKSRRTGEKLMFLTDAFYIPIKPPEGLTQLMVECNHSLALLERGIADGETARAQRERIRRSHLSLETLCAWLEQNGERLKALQEIHLLHISSRNGSRREFTERIKEITGKVVV